MVLAQMTLKGPAGPLEALLKLPRDGPPRGAAVVAHPHPLYGGTLHNKVVYSTARILEGQGFAVLRFNFRGVGASAGRFDHGVGESADLEAALAEMGRRFPGLPLLAGGYSFGSWIALEVGSRVGVDLLLAVAPPVELYDFAFLERSTTPVAVIGGAEDPFAPADRLESTLRTWPGLRHLEILPGVGHDLAQDRPGLEKALGRAMEALVDGPSS